MRHLIKNRGETRLLEKETTDMGVLNCNVLWNLKAFKFNTRSRQTTCRSERP